MSWAKYAKEKLKIDKQVSIRPCGNSMRGKIESRQLVTLQTCKFADLKVNDIVLVTVKGNDYLHLIKAIDKKRFLIGNNHGGINGWVNFNAIHGKVLSIK
ncbi:hypothetical protein CMI47_13190 [Candidatus Pacearchaeota archaeon]|nr:hypothetical protein [Candidatus Pacearchaeota archaeon]|tara:strand:- start:1345 stop:1644 length:300 start_codon:yes stop_codon:yes gene_type:complete